MVKVIGAELAPLITSAFPPVAVVEDFQLPEHPASGVPAEMGVTAISFHFIHSCRFG
jgi:hypothetical protein